MAPKLSDLQKISVAADPTPGKGIALGSDGKVVRAVLPQQITGVISTVSTVVSITSGTGFTIVRNSAGNYTVTYTSTFTASPVAFFTVLNNQPIAMANLTAISTTAFTVEWRTAAGVAQDQNWHFFVVSVV